MIRTESREVLVDAVAVDKKGKFATDLTEKDFRVWEDGREQQINGFSLESSGVTAERPSKHYIALFFDTSTGGQAAQMDARQEAIRFVDGFASPDRYMAVINYNLNGGMRITQNFSTDRDLLKKALSVMPPASNSAPPAALSTAAAPRGGRGGGGSAPGAPSADGFAYREMLTSLRNLAASLATVRGRKALVFFSGKTTAGSDVSLDLSAAIKACNKANVAVYAVSSGTQSAASQPDSAQPGRNPRTGAIPDIGVSAELNIADALAEGTGGILFQSTSNLAALLGKVAQEQDQYYLLSYIPKVESAEGSCHELRVKVDRGDLEVRARREYCTAKPVDLLSGKPVGKDLETRAAANTQGNIAAAMQLPWFYSAPNVARVNLAMDFNPSSMKFQKDKGKFHAEIDLAGVAWKADGTAAARVSDAVKLDFDTQLQVDAFLKTPYHYENQFEIAPGQYTFRMAFSSDASGAHDFGKAELPLNIDRWDGQTLSMSGIALSHDAHPAADLAAGLDVDLLEGMRPLVARGIEVVPSGVNRFHPGERGYIYVEAYEPELTAAKPDSMPVIGIRVRVLDRVTGQQKEDTGAKTAGSFYSGW